MQIFSKLQRNSAYYIFIKIIFWFFIAILNSKFIFMPLLFTIIFLCENLFLSIFYLSLFAILHKLSLFSYFTIFISLIFFKIYIYKFIDEWFNPIYKPIISSFLIYFILLITFGVNNFVLIYLLYNLSIDITLIRIFKCEPTLL